MDMLSWMRKLLLILWICIPNLTDAVRYVRYIRYSGVRYVRYVRYSGIRYVRYYGYSYTSVSGSIVGAVVGGVIAIGGIIVGIVACVILCRRVRRQQSSPGRVIANPVYRPDTETVVTGYVNNTTTLPPGGVAVTTNTTLYPSMAPPSYDQTVDTPPTQDTPANRNTVS